MLKVIDKIKAFFIGSICEKEESLSYEKEFMDIIEATPLRLRELEGISPDQLDFNKSAKKYLKNDGSTADVSVDANANVDTKDVVGYTYELPKPLFKLNSLYILWKQIGKTEGTDKANEILKAELSGSIYINDSSDLGKPYCYNYSTYDIVMEGLPMIKKIKSTAPKSLYAFKSQVEQFIIIASNSTLGATGLADILICMGLYVDKMKINGYRDGHIQLEKSEDALWTYVDETITSLIYTLNQPMRGNQSPFTNVSLFDKVFLEDLCPDYKLPNYPSVLPSTVMRIQEVYMEVMNREMRRTPITFPVTTPCFASEDGIIKDQDFVQKVAEESTEWGFMNFYTGSTSTLSSCCRLRSDKTSEYFNSFGSGSTKIGSLGVVTLPLRRYAEEAGGSFGYFIDLMLDGAEKACLVNQAKRAILQKRIDQGNMPLYSYGFMDLKTQYSTIGITGLYEAMSYLGLSLETPEGLEVTKEVLGYLNKVCDEYALKYNAPHNLEQVPGESSAIKLADKASFFNLNEDSISFYSNQYIPPQAPVDMLTRMRIQGQLDGHLSGGSILHINMEKPIEDKETYVDLINENAKCGCIYWAANYSIKECAEGHMFTSSVCQCGLPAESTYTRVVGFLTKISNWNRVRREEDHPARTRY